MPARLSAFVAWALVAASIVFWALRLWVFSPQAPAYTIPLDTTAAARGDLARLFGSGEAPVVSAPPAVASRFRLIGVVAPKAGTAEGGGVALIAIDGKPARPYRIGARVDGELMLRSVAQRSATLGSAGGTSPFTLEIPPRAAPATGTLASISLIQPQPQTEQAQQQMQPEMMAPPPMMPPPMMPPPDFPPLEESMPQQMMPPPPPPPPEQDGAMPPTQ